MVCLACDSKSPREVFINGKPFCQVHGVFGDAKCSKCSSRARIFSDGSYTCMRHGSIGSCPICLEDLKDFQVTQCGHMFHKKCLRAWRRESHTCPTCRTGNLDLALVMMVSRYLKLGEPVEQNHELFAERLGEGHENRRDDGGVSHENSVR
jgi:hypothetical protein